MNILAGTTAAIRHQGRRFQGRRFQGRRFLFSNQRLTPQATATAIRHDHQYQNRINRQQQQRKQLELIRKHSFHASTVTKFSKSKDAPFVQQEVSSEALYRALTPSVRAAIIADLNSVDADGNGRIDADELKTLLRKYNETFTDDEITELSELYYASLGAQSVEISRFLEALDAVADDRGTSGGGEMQGKENIAPLATAGKVRSLEGSNSKCQALTVAFVHEF